MTDKLKIINQFYSRLTGSLRRAGNRFPGAIRYFLNMPNNLKLEFSGGYNGTATAFNLPPAQLLDLTGCEVNYGAVRNKLGNTSLVSGGGPIASQTDAYTVTSYGGFLVAVTDQSGTGKIFNSSNLSTTWNDITGATSPTRSPLESWAVLNSILVYSNSGGSMIKWTGSGNAAALAGTPPANVTCIKTVNNFLFTGKGSTIQWSSVSDPETWPATNVLDFRKGDGDTIKAFSSIGTDLIIFKSGSIGRLSTTTQTISGAVTLGPLSTITEKIGIAGPVAVDNLNDGSLVFLGSNNHFYRYDGSVLFDLSDRAYPQPNVQGILNTIRNGGFNYYALVRCNNSSNQVWISFDVSSGTITTKDTTIIYDVAKDYWMVGNHGIQSACNYVAAATIGTYQNTLFVTTSPAVGNIFAEDNGLWYSGNTSVNVTFTASILYPPESRGFIPRSVEIPYSSDVDNTIVVTLGWDGVMDSTSTTIAITSSALSRYVLPVTAWKTNHRSMQVRIVTTIDSNGGNFAFYPLYISDEIVS